MTTPKALRVSPSSDAAPSAAFWFKSAITTRAPSRAKTLAMSLPMPLAAPVTMATLSFRRMSSNPCSDGSQRRRCFALGRRRLQIIMGDPAHAERQIANEVNSRDDLQHRQFCDRGERMRGECERRRTGPGALEHDILEVILDQFADPRAAVDVRNDLEEV